MFKDFLKKQGKEEDFLVLSAATSGEEIGNPVYPPAKRELLKHGISCEGKRAVKLQPSDCEKYDYILCMDESNLRNINRIFKGDGQGKVSKILDYYDGGEVADPWYTGDFSKTYADLERGIQAFYEFLTKNIVKNS